MKRYTYSAIILLAAIALAGCSKTEEFQYKGYHAHFVLLDLHHRLKEKISTMV